MARCEKKISDCISASCTNPIYTGIDQKAWIFNKSDITITEDDDDANVITDIATIGTAVGYTITQFGKTPYSGTQSSMVEGNASNKFNHTFACVVSDNSHTAAHNIIDKLANGKFVVVVNNDYSGSDKESKYQVYGGKKGLTASAIENDKYSEETDGGWAISLVEENSPVSAQFLVPTLGTGETMAQYMAAIAPDCAGDE